MFDGQACALGYLPLPFLLSTLDLCSGFGIGLRWRAWKTQCVLFWDVLQRPYVLEHACLPCDCALASMKAGAGDITVAVDARARHARPKKFACLGGVSVVAFP